MRQDGSLVDEFRLSHGTEHVELEEFARKYAGSEVAIEATGHYRPIYETLDEHMDVTIVNPSKTRVIADAKVKTDRVDAKMLTHLLRANLVAESYVPPRDVRERRDLVRARKALVQDRTREKTVSEQFSSVPVTNTAANCSARPGVSSSRNPRSPRSIDRFLRHISR
ncbi:IS110 family transposase [Natrialbaceae archaeon A-CW1-1]